MDGVGPGSVGYLTLAWVALDRDEHPEADIWLARLDEVEAVIPEQRRRGSPPRALCSATLTSVWSRYYGHGVDPIVAESGQAWDAVLLVSYPSRRAFFEMVRDAVYQTARTCTRRR
jgi:hypothetical protein